MNLLPGCPEKPWAGKKSGESVQISQEEFIKWRIAYKEWLKRCVEDSLQKNDEDNASDIISLAFGNDHFDDVVTSQDALKMYYKRFTNEQLLYRTILAVYTNDGYRFPKEVMQKAAEIAPSVPVADRLGDLTAGDPVIVYRGCSASSSLERLHEAFSWTTDIDTAVFFAFRRSRKGRAVYRASIPREKIIAYTNCRNEHEILQYKAVESIEILPLSDEEISAVFDRREESLDEW